MSAAGFSRPGNHLCCDTVSLLDLAGRFQTPLYVYSDPLLEETFRSYDRAFASARHLVCYAAKANGSGALLRRLAELGAGVDVVSGFELEAALEAGYSPDRIHFGGAGKTRAEIDFALARGVELIVDSLDELRRVAERAAARRTNARVSLRLNLDIDTGAHPYHAVGKRTSKFGIESSHVADIGRFAASLPHVRIVGLHAHVGSQLFDHAPYVRCAKAFVELVAELRQLGHPVELVNLGGGLGIDYATGQRASPADLAAAILPILASLDVTVLVEPGRSLVGQSGVLLTEVLYRKVSYGRVFLIVDAGMNDFIRPALYQATHRIEPVVASQRETERVDIVGPVCEEGDYFVRDYPLERVEAGEILAIRDVGAYGFCMSSNYNLRPRAAEVLVRGASARLVRRRESYDDLVRTERLS